MNILQDIIKQYREQQQKYVYYLIALSVAAIAFSVSNTIGEPIKWTQIPLAVAVILWGYSIHCGISSIGYFVGSLASNVHLIKAKRANSPIQQEISEAIENVSDKTKNLVKRQLYLMYIGAVCYVVWHVIEMILIT